MSTILLVLMPISSTLADVLDLTYSFETITLNGDTEIYRYDFELKTSTPDIYGISFNNIFIGDKKFINSTSPLQSSLTRTLEAVDASGTPIAALKDIPFAWTPTLVNSSFAGGVARLINEQPSELHMGWRIFFGQGGDGHGWTPNGTDSSFAWSAYASNQVMELYFSYEDNRRSIPDGQSSVSENWQLAHGPSPVPEPQTYVLMFLGLACISMVKIRRQSAAR